MQTILVSIFLPNFHVKEQISGLLFHIGSQSETQGNHGNTSVEYIIIKSAGYYGGLLYCPKGLETSVPLLYHSLVQIQKVFGSLIELGLGLRPVLGSWLGVNIRVWVRFRVKVRVMNGKVKDRIV